MKALTVRQPWAWAIVHGGKDVENRTQAWGYRGPLAIHAGSRTSERGLRTVPSIVAAERDVSPTLVGDEMRGLVFGAVLGVVDLVGIHTAEDGCCESWWAETSYDEHGGHTRRDIVHLVLEHPRPLVEPIQPPADVLEQLDWCPLDQSCHADVLLELANHPGAAA